MDIELILDSAEIMAPTLKGTTRRILEAEARRMDVSLEVTDVLLRRAEGVPEVHMTAAADELLAHLVATEADPLSDGSHLTVLARIGAQAIVTRAEVEDDHQAEAGH